SFPVWCAMRGRPVPSAVEVSSSGAVTPLATVSSPTWMDPCLISGTGGVGSGPATLFAPTAQDEVAVKSKIPAAQMHAKRFNALPNMDSVAVGLLFDCM